MPVINSNTSDIGFGCMNNGEDIMKERLKQSFSDMAGLELSEEDLNNLVEMIDAQNKRYELFLQKNNNNNGGATNE